MQLAVRRKTGRRNQDLTEKRGERARGEWMEEKDAAKHQNATKQNIPRRGNNNERAGNQQRRRLWRLETTATVEDAESAEATRSNAKALKIGKEGKRRGGTATRRKRGDLRSDARARSLVYEPRASCRVYHFLPHTKVPIAQT